MLSNITLSVETDLLIEAAVLAATSNTSVSELFSGWLWEYAHGGTGLPVVFARARSAGPYHRDDANER